MLTKESLTKLKLKEHQIHCDTRYGHNAGWFNHLGERIGHGDLNANDILNIMDNLNDDEIFIVLSEQSNYEIVTLKEDINEKDAVIERARFAIFHKRVFMIVSKWEKKFVWKNKYATPWDEDKFIIETMTRYNLKCKCKTNPNFLERLKNMVTKNHE